MRILFFGAGPLGSVYAHLLHENGEDVTVLDRGKRYDWVKKNGLVTINEMTGEKNTSRVNVANELKPEDEYDLVIVLIRKNKLPPVFKVLASRPGLKNILFMGNNALGFDEYLKHLPAEKLLFGFPGAGGGIQEQIVHYADREKPSTKRKAVTIGTIHGKNNEQAMAAKNLFESSGVPVDLTATIDGWLKYHVALVSPLVGALYKHDCDCNLAANDNETCRALVRAAKEGGDVLRALGYLKREPFQYNLFYWLPEFMNVMAVKGLLHSKFAEIAFAMHARAARDEFQDLAREFDQLVAKTSLDTPNIDNLKSYIFNPEQRT